MLDDEETELSVSRSALSYKAREGCSHSLPASKAKGSKNRCQAIADNGNEALLGFLHQA